MLSEDLLTRIEHNEVINLRTDKKKNSYLFTD